MTKAHLGLMPWVSGS